MVAFSKQLLAAVVVCGVVQAHPHAKTFQFGSLNPAWVVKRALYNLEKISDQGQKDKLTQGLKDAVTIAAKALEKMDDDKHKDKLDFWFGDKHSDDNGRELVRQVYKNFVGSNTDGTGADVLANVVVDETDYWKPTADNLPNTPADGNTPYCDLEVDGKSGTAYFKRNNNKPGMHFCNKVWDRADLATLLANDCSSLSGQVSTRTWSKNFIGSNVLHEFMHYPRVGREALGSHITDWKYDAWQCRALAANKDEAEREKTLTNADTYVWYALHIAFEELCGRTFSGPRDERDDDETNQDWPDSDPETADPTNGACDCDENGCSPDSYSCCANGTCE